MRAFSRFRNLPQSSLIALFGAIIATPVFAATVPANLYSVWASDQGYQTDNGYRFDISITNSVSGAASQKILVYDGIETDVPSAGYPDTSAASGYVGEVDLANGWYWDSGIPGKGQCVATWVDWRTPAVAGVHNYTFKLVNLGGGSPYGLGTGYWYSAVTASTGVGPGGYVYAVPNNDGSLKIAVKPNVPAQSFLVSSNGQSVTTAASALSNSSPSWAAGYRVFTWRPPGSWLLKNTAQNYTITARLYDSSTGTNYYYQTTVATQSTILALTPLAQSPISSPQFTINVDDIGQWLWNSGNNAVQSSLSSITIAGPFGTTTLPASVNNPGYVGTADPSVVMPTAFNLAWTDPNFSGGAGSYAYTVSVWANMPYDVYGDGSYFATHLVQIDTKTITVRVGGSAQSIAFSSPGNTRTVGNAFALGATATSGLPITYSVVVGAGTIAGDNFTPSIAGPIVVRASQSGNGTYAFAPDVDQAFIVGAGNQTVTLPTPSSPHYNGETFNPGATSSSGLTYFVYNIVSGPAVAHGPTTTSPSNVTLTGTGTVVLTATQVGNSNWNSATSAPLTFTVVSENIPPTAPGALNYATKTATTVTLIWRASTDNVGVTGYFIYRGGTQIGTTNTPVFTDNGLMANTAYSYTVKAFDAAGNLSAASNTLPVTTTQDFSTDGDRDGLPDAVETALGTNGSAAGNSDTTNLTQQNIHRPTP